MLRPVTATSSSRSIKWSSKRLTSSMYRKPRLARARSPGSKVLTPSFNARSMLIVPHTRSSVAPRGRSTTGTGASSRISFPFSSSRARQSPQRFASSKGSQPYRQSRTRAIAGRRSARARTAVDFPVPRWPIISTPPIFGSITFRSRANFISSWPTMAVKG